MPKGMGLEELKTVFSDNKTHIALGKITRIALANDRSYMRVMVSIWPDEREIIAKMTWDSCGDNSGIFSFPQVNDLVLVAFAEGDNEQCFVIRRLTSLEEKIPLQAVDGSTAIVSNKGTKSWISSDTGINLSRGVVQPTENLVLGQQLKILLSELLHELSLQAQKLADLQDAIQNHQHLGNLGFPTGTVLDPSPYISAKSEFSGNKSNFDNWKGSPVDDSKILSDFAFTEK